MRARPKPRSHPLPFGVRFWRSTFTALVSAERVLGAVARSKGQYAREPRLRSASVWGYSALVWGRVCFALVAANLLAACESRASLSSIFPTGIDWVAAVAQDPATQEVSSATPLQPANVVLPLSHRIDDDLWFVGYEASSLGGIRNAAAAQGLDLYLVVGSAPLAAPHVCRERLPAPTWGARRESTGELEEVPSHEVPGFTARWLSELCPTLPKAPDSMPEQLSPLSLELNGRFCDREALRQSGCALSLDWSRCGLDVTSPVEFQLQWDGRMCPIEETTCAPATSDGEEPPSARFDCRLGAQGQVDLRVHVPTLDEDAGFVNVEQVRVTDEELPQREPPGSVSPDVIQGSHISALIELGDEVVATFHPERRNAKGCDGRASTHLVFVDQPSMRLVRTATAPNCLTRLATHPDGGFMGAFEDVEGEFSVGRFDVVGRETQRVVLPRASTTPVLRPVFLEYLPGLDRVVIILTPADRNGRDQFASYTRVFTLDRNLSVLSERPFPEVDGERDVSMAAVHRVETEDGPRLVFAEDTTSRYFMTDLEVTRIENSATLDLPVGGSRRVLAFLQLSDRRMLVSGGGDAPLIGEAFSAPNRVVEREAYCYEADAEVSVMAPLGPDLVLAMLKPRNDNSFSTYLGRFDTRAWRFIPGSPRLRRPDGQDPGPATRVLLDGKGRIWLGFSNSPYLARIEAKDPG